MTIMTKIAVSTAFGLAVAGFAWGNEFVVKSGADNGGGTLREALSMAKDGDSVVFDLAHEKWQVRLSSPLRIDANAFPKAGLQIRCGLRGECVSMTGNGGFQLLYIGGGNVISIENISFAQGSAASGGAIENHGTLFLRRCEFNDNFASSWGGAVATWGTQGFYAISCKFFDNECKSWGGALCVHTGNATLVNCLFESNRCASWGGAVSLFSSSATVTGCTFEGNVCDAHGGALSAKNSGSVEIVDSTFRLNDAASGGGVSCWDSADMRLIGCTFQGNHATSANAADIFGGCVTRIGIPDAREDRVPEPKPYIAVEYSQMSGLDTRALGGWYSPQTNVHGKVHLRLNSLARPCFAPRKGCPLLEVDMEDCVSMEVENGKPFLYYGLGWSDTPNGDYRVEPGRWIQADANGNLPGEVKAPKGKGSSRFFRVKVTDDPSVIE